MGRWGIDGALLRSIVLIYDIMPSAVPIVKWGGMRMRWSRRRPGPAEVQYSAWRP